MDNKDFVDNNKKGMYVSRKKRLTSSTLNISLTLCLPFSLSPDLFLFFIASLSLVHSLLGFLFRFLSPLFGGLLSHFKFHLNKWLSFFFKKKEKIIFNKY